MTDFEPPNAAARPRVLVIARNYPNPALPTLGLWTERLVHCSLPIADPTVISAIPFVPPGAAFAFAARHRTVPRMRHDVVDVYHPRVPVGPGMALHAFDRTMSYPFIQRVADALHQERPFALLHGHFIYPDGVIAERLGRRYGIPVVTTEPAWWIPWLNSYPRVRRQVERALPGISTVMVVSETLGSNIHAAVGDRVTTEVVPNIVDDAMFRAPQPGESRDTDQLLFVGLIRRVKGLDILVRALGLLATSRPTVRLLVLGAGFYRGYQRDEQEVRQLVVSLGLADRVHFAGQASPESVAAAMRSSALLVVPSRRETFSVVTAEALASGIPVVATRCGGPDEILTPELGVLVPIEDPPALATAIDETLRRLSSFDRKQLRDSAVSRYGRAAITRRLGKVYSRALASRS
ncbi:MAG: glycosyltransferase [Gemmatimonadaceae bacterium]